MADEFLVGEIATLFMAGFETTGVWHCLLL